MRKLVLRLMKLGARFKIVFLAFLVCTAYLQGSDNRSQTKDATFSVDFPNTEVRVILRSIADIQELNLVIPEELSGSTSIKLRDVTWKQAFQVILEPIGYTWIADGNVIKVIPKENPNTPAPRRTEGDNLLIDGPWYFAFAISLGLGVLSLCHIILCIGVARDNPQQGTLFAPKIVWAILVLAGGVIPLVGYWILHYSNLRPQVVPGTKAN